jgi:hypothetical protein
MDVIRLTIEFEERRFPLSSDGVKDGLQAYQYCRSDDRAAVFCDKHYMIVY